MVDEKTATRALTGSRRLHLSFQPLVATYVTATGIWSVDTTSSASWRQVGFSNWYQENYFDTSGYTRDQLTAMPVNAFIQEAGRYQITFPGNMRMMVLDLITTERIDDVLALITEITASNSGIPSFPNSTEDWSQVIYGQFRELTGITQADAVQDVFAPVSNQQFGSLEPTTCDKLWVYKIIMAIGLPQGDPESLLRFPNSRMVLNIDVVKEDDLEFMMRQKRSYELTNY